MIAFLFPGQSSEYRGMGLEVATAFPAARAFLEHGSALLGRDLQDLLARGGRDLLRPEAAQLAVAACSLGALAVLDEHQVRPQLTLGHSAGELAAAAAAGYLTGAHALEAYAVRAREMARAARARRGGMATLEGTHADLRRALTAGASRGALVDAGQLAASRWLLSGDEAALRLAAATAPLVRLDVGGAWHSPLMEDAEPAYRAALRERLVGRGRLGATWVSNQDGCAVPADAKVDSVCARLATQLTGPMRFHDSLSTLLRATPRHVVLVGPARALRGLLRLNAAAPLPFTLHGTETLSELEATLRVLDGGE